MLTEDGLRDALLQLGWRAGRAIGRLSVLMARHYTLMFEGVRVTGTARIDLVSTVSSYILSTGTFDPHITWTSDAGSPTHPHGVDPGGSPPHDLCYSAGQVGDSEMTSLQVALMINRAPTVYNEDSLADTRWQPCYDCDNRGYNTSCGPCGRTVCADCWVAHNECHGNEEDAAVTEAAADREIAETSPSLGIVEHVMLIGCGVTGSWVHAVLARTARSVYSLDPDTVSTDNPHGHWGCHYGARKSAAVAEVRYGGYSYSAGGVLEEGRQTTPWGIAMDLIVLCPDNAAARLRVRDHNCRILDVRSTTTGLTVWALPPGDSDLRTAWLGSLSGYPTHQPCAGHHDNVQISAGLLAASFTAWWMTNGMPSGVWSVPYGYTGMTFDEQSDAAGREENTGSHPTSPDR